MFSGVSCKAFHDKQALLPHSTFICPCSSIGCLNTGHQTPLTWPWISYLQCFQRMTHPPASHLRPAGLHPMRPGLWGRWQGPHSLWWSGWACPALRARCFLPAEAQPSSASNETERSTSNLDPPPLQEQNCKLLATQSLPKTCLEEAM